MAKYHGEALGQSQWTNYKIWTCTVVPFLVLDCVLCTTVVVLTWICIWPKASFQKAAKGPEVQRIGSLLASRGPSLTVTSSSSQHQLILSCLEGTRVENLQDKGRMDCSSPGNCWRTVLLVHRVGVTSETAELYYYPVSCNSSTLSILWTAFVANHLQPCSL